MLTEFGPALGEGPWRAFERRLFFAGGGFNTDSPGSLLDVIDTARRRMGARPQLVHYLAVPPTAFGELTSALGKHGLAEDAPGRLREAVRHLAGELPPTQPSGTDGARRVAGLPDRPLPRQGSDAEPARPAGAALDVRPATVRLPLVQMPEAEPLPPYVKLIHDVPQGDRSLFTRPAGLAAAWRTIQPILAAPPRLARYAQGSWGPPAARKLAAPHRWLLDPLQ